jgi:hypothetical protein
MAGQVPSGTETRAEILPKANMDDASFIMPKYDFAAEVTPPDAIGVKRGNTLESVVNASRGIVYYTDVIGFGESSSPLTKGLPFQHLGINFFMKSGLTCPNGADMWTYFQGIPDGSALGTRIRDTVSRMGLPQMRGLAPGMLEDTKAALNPKPLMQAAFGSVLPVCEKVTLPVGDEVGKVEDAAGNKYVQGDIQYRDGRPTQTRWVQSKDKIGELMFTDAKTFDSTEKTHNPDGSLKSGATEGFEGNQKASLVVAIVLLTAAWAITCRSK